MDNDLLAEELFLLSEGRKRVGKSYNSLLNYIRLGRSSATGNRVYLEAVVTEGGIATSVEAFRRFRRNLNDKDVRYVKRKGKTVPAVRMQSRKA